MFYYIEGVVTEIDSCLAVVDCGGVGFAINTSLHSLSKVCIGEKSKFYTYLSVREDAMDIYGFITALEKHCFMLLTSVSGVGPKAALSILSSTTPEGLAGAIINENEKLLTAAQGIGKKIAQRIILELKDKIQKETANISLPQTQTQQYGNESNHMRDAAAALTVLGYGSQEIRAVLKDVEDGLSLENTIRQALKKLAH